MRPSLTNRPAGDLLRRAWLLGLLAASGCGGGEKKAATRSVSEPQTVRLVSPKVETITRVVKQPSFIQAYEHTSIYAKLPSYIEKWNVDIGDRVKKDQVMATLFMPELVEERRTKQADVVLAERMIDRAVKLQDVAKADVDAAKARVSEAKSILAKFQAEVDRWDSEVKRLSAEVSKGVVAPQILLESENQLKSNTAAREAAKSTIAAAEADLVSKQSADAKADVDVAVARAQLAVAQSEEKRLAALEGYLTLPAPFDGVIVGRNANTGDFVTPATGDPTARDMSPYKSPEGAAPVYVVDRTDIVRIFVDIPEQDANYVSIGTKATVLAKAYRDEEIPASVTRTSWALNVKSRTLRAEIDLKNSDGQLLPGMYAYGKVIIERPDVRTVPVEALVYSGDNVYCWMHRDGKAVRTEVETGIGDGSSVEITNHRPVVPAGAPEGDRPWTAVDGSEQVILGDLAILTDDAPVKIAPDKPEAKVADASPR
ncbi:efflux RND transporter periplasmic adaptor subunit [Tundrisphaera sp. TA3]|uniref:efflux RND transporter periplasmic adaptor subunit n=1 Tax=Tundrisphaera sp. TA3 TaxID=3435775 RepID=UPI003EBEC0E8